MESFLKNDINALIKKLTVLSEGVQKGAKDDLKVAAKIVADEMSRQAPVGKKSHKRRAGLSSRGNLKAAMKVLKFRRAKYSVFAGPQSKKGRLPDGFYAPFLEFGTVYIPHGPHSFISKAVNLSLNKATSTAVSLIRRRVALQAEKVYRTSRTGSGNYFTKYAKAKGRQ